MIGAIVGDIVGSPYEFDNIKTKIFPLFSRHGRFTDDSVMTLAIFRALMDCQTGKRFENSAKEDIFSEEVSAEFKKKYANLQNNAIERMKEYARGFPDAGYGANFAKWAFSDEKTSYNSWGNGAAMRVSSVAYFARNLGEVKFLSYLVTSVTHNHPNAIIGAEATAVATFLALHGMSKQQIKEHIEKNYPYSLDFNLKDLQENYTYHIGCKNCVPQALFCFLESKDFSDALKNTISIGGDSDTLGAICGAVAGAFHGVPEKIEDCAVGYLDKFLAKDVEDFKNFFGENLTLNQKTIAKNDNEK